MELNDAELSRIRSAYLSCGPLNYERLALAKAQGERKALLKFIEAWDKLDIEEQAAISSELARMASSEGNLTADFDVGLAAFRAADAGRNRSGNKVREPGFREAVLEAANIWIERGNEWSRGNIHRETNRWQPYPMLSFVMEAVVRALPSEAIERATLGNPPSQEEIMRAVDTQLRR